MALRDCKHCWKTVEDEEHYWFCPFGSGVRPHGPKKSQRGANNGGGGGGEPGESNIPTLPSGGGSGGVEVLPPCLELSARGRAVLLSPSDQKPVMIENQPTLALPAPLEVRDEQKLRRDGVGKW